VEKNELQESCARLRYAVCGNSRNALAGNRLLRRMMAWRDSGVEHFSAVFDWVEGWCRPHSKHLSLGMVKPGVHEILVSKMLISARWKYQPLLSRSRVNSKANETGTKTQKTPGNSLRGRRFWTATVFSDSGPS